MICHLLRIHLLCLKCIRGKIDWVEWLDIIVVGLVHVCDWDLGYSLSDVWLVASRDSILDIDIYIVELHGVACGLLHTFSGWMASRLPCHLLLLQLLTAELISIMHFNVLCAGNGVVHHGLGAASLVVLT